METFQLRYFKHVAETENIRQSSIKLNISPSALSKAISRLEKELEIKLFERVGRNIKITEDGKELKKMAGELLALEKGIVNQFRENTKEISVKIVGAEMALSYWGPQMIKRLSKINQKISFQLVIKKNGKALSMVEDYSADIAIFSSSTSKSGKFYKRLSVDTFKCFVSNNHPLGKRKSVEIDDLLNYHFVTGSSDLYGEHSSMLSNDGWRDDKFTRKSITEINSLKTIENLVVEGLAIVYLPEYIGNKLKLKVLEIKNCPYSCRQYIYAVRGKYEINNIWSLI